MLKLPEKLLKRTQVVTSASLSATGPVVYWMVRDQRAHDNWALTTAQHLAETLHVPLHVVSVLRRDLNVHHGTERMGSFMLEGLKETAQTLAAHNITYTLLVGDPIPTLTQYLTGHTAAAVCVDMFPLSLYQDWLASLSKSVCIPVYRVDAHNCVPVWIASPKKEYAARTFRPKINKLLKEYLVDAPQLTVHHFGTGRDATQWRKVTESIQLDKRVGAVQWLRPGSKAALAVAEAFCADHLHLYASQKNDPTQDALSNLSPYLHFGQLSAQRLVQLVHSQKDSEGKTSYLEELVVRRELADNFCFYSPTVTDLTAAPAWAQATLEKHRHDRREHIYTQAEFEEAQTHDAAWNAAQNQLLKTGKMHGYMRMYWAKKILEWSATPEEALTTAIYLNDRYELDGRDPNGYVGILWSIAGVHDRPWFERPVFGTIRSMVASGLARKFDLTAYCAQWT